MATSRLNTRVGRDVQYQALDAEASAISEPNGITWAAKVVAQNADGTVNLIVFRSNGTTLAKLAVAEGPQKGYFSTSGLGGSAP